MIFNTKKLSKFLEEFNPLYQKYFGENVLPVEYLKKVQRREIEDFISKQQENFFAREKLSADEMLKVYNIVEKVYVNTYTEEDYVYIYQEIQDKFLDEFVNIDGIKDLYQPLFFVFEWMMHLEYRPEKDSYSLYRDHFIHQVRNMHEMIRILTDKEFEMYKVCMNCFESGNSLLDFEMKAAVRNSIKTGQGIEDFQDIAQRLSMEQSDCKEMIYRYILMASAVVTSVVHDIGYTIEFLSRNLKMMEGFLPVSGYFFEMKSYADKLHILLEESLLYRIVAPEKISKRLKRGDHGAVSACVLLIKYYKSGKIHTLSPVQKMIIELSALTIYDHTLGYKLHGEENPDKYQPVFEENPFSFLFRLCDDIEEWDRTYFEVTKQSNFLICNKCHTIINPWLFEKDSDNNVIKYACCCGIKGENRNSFKYRKMVHINACDTIALEKIERKNPVGISKNKIGYKIKLDYDLIALLKTAAYGEQFAVKRAKALTEIKEMTFDQKGIYSVYIDSFISNNPVVIKAEIMRLYMKTINSNEWQKIVDNYRRLNDLNSVFENVWNEDYSSLVCEIQDKYFSDTDMKIQELFRENLIFYLRIAILQEYLKVHSKDNKEDVLLNLTTVITDKERIFLGSLSKLINDALEQSTKMVSEDDFWKDKWKIRDNYFSMFKQSKMISSAVKSYIKSPLYDYVRVRTASDNGAKDKLKELGIEEKDCRYDFYSDYGLFQSMYREYKEFPKF